MPNDRFNGYCEKLLASYKRRNTQSLTRHLDALCGFLRQKGEVVQTVFGGSVKKGTYVTGLSDVDVLLIVNESSLVNQPPAQVKRYVLETIRHRLPNNPVHAGKLAVTVTYSDKTEIQLLPAIRTKKGGVRIAQEGTRGWSKVARPDDFANMLAKVNHARKRQGSPGNQACQGDGRLPHRTKGLEAQRLSHRVAGYRCLQELSGPPRPQSHAQSPVHSLDDSGLETDHRLHRAVETRRRVSWRGGIQGS